MKIHIYHHSVNDCEEKSQLDRIEEKLDQLLGSGSNDEAIKKAASDLDTSTNELKAAVDKNTPAS